MEKKKTRNINIHIFDFDFDEFLYNIDISCLLSPWYPSRMQFFLF